MPQPTRFHRLTAIGLLAAAATAFATVALPGLAERAVNTRPDADDLWARVGALEAWYYANGYTQSPPPAAPPALQRDAFQSPAIRPASTTLTATSYLPFVAKNHSPAEFRGVWVSRFDWTRFGVTPTAATLDTLLADIKTAHFNAILFQVRGTADAYYTPGLEPWAARMTGQLTKTLGVDPGWDPLAYLVAQAHAQRIQVHAYINAFPTWLCGLGAPPQPVTPTHLFWTLSYSVTWDDWRAWTTAGPDSIATCADYVWATPALSLTRAHVAAVAADLASRYDIDGIHLDLARYPSSAYSYDPFTQRAFTEALALSPTLTITDWRPGFQRAQIDDLVSRVYSAATGIRPDVWVSAAVWPNYTTGRNSYYQDSKSWLAGGIVDANLPMLYSSDIVTDLAAWTARMQDFLGDSQGRWVIPGIGFPADVDAIQFADIAARIEAARAAGARGVAIFSYGALNAKGYFDDLGAGPFADAVEVPRPPWKP